MAEYIRNVDILIIGGGPSGLLTAAKLGLRQEVALIESGKISQTTKYWLATKRRLLANGLEDSILLQIPSMVAGTYLGSSIRIYGDLAAVDDSKLLIILKNRCIHNNVKLYEYCTLLSISWADGFIIANTTMGLFRSRLLIDASGGNTPLGSTFRLHHINGFYAVYGAHLTNIDLHNSEVILAQIDFLGNPPTFNEVIPTSSYSAFCAVFTCTKYLPRPEILRQAFTQFCSHNEYFAQTPYTYQMAIKEGAIPIGRMRRKQLPRILPIGEAGMIQPPLMATAFNEILEHVDGLSEHILNIMSNSAKLLLPSYHFPLIKSTQNYLQGYFVGKLVDSNVEYFDKMVRKMATFPHPLVFKFCSNELEWNDLLKALLYIPNCLFQHRRSIL